MRKKILFFIAGFSFFLLSCKTNNNNSEGITSAKADSAVKQTLAYWNYAIKNKDLQRAMNLFDTTNDIILIGSDSSEISRGPKEIETFFKYLFAQPFSVSWRMDRIDISHNENTAWAFADGILTITSPTGEETKMPYRFTAIMVQKANNWKWKLYNGSVPMKG